MPFVMSEGTTRELCATKKDDLREKDSQTVGKTINRIKSRTRKGSCDNRKRLIYQWDSHRRQYPG
jgi:hypothetical protein